MSELLTAHRVIADHARREPDRDFLLQPVNGELRTTSFQQADDQARRMAAALQGLGLARGDRVAIFAKNSAEWIIADLAIAMAGMVSVPIYPNANADTASYIVGHSECRAVFIGKLDDPGVAAVAIPASLPTIGFPYEQVDARHSWEALIEATDPIATVHEPAGGETMTILYTSGSTGRPKGVVISYAAYIYGCRTAAASSSLDQDSRALCYLMLAHVTERMAIIGPCLYAGARVYFVESLETFRRDLAAAQVTAFASVPRLWSKFQGGVHARIPPRKLRLLLAIPGVGGVVARRIRAQLGFANCTKYGSGTAPISPQTLQWYRRLGIDISEGWGMTETSGLSCSNMPYSAQRLGTIGTPVDGTELKVSEEGELLIRSPGLFTEYYKQPELTADVFTSDGYFRTGDKAEWVEACSAWRITGRVKDMFKSAKGKYVVPVPIESRLSANPLLEQVCVVGSGLPAPVALVVLSEAGRQLPRETVARSLQATLADTNTHLETHERLSTMLVVDEEWTAENELLTPTLKLKRDRLEAHYAAAIARDLQENVAWERDL